MQNCKATERRCATSRSRCSSRAAARRDTSARRRLPIDGTHAALFMVMLDANTAKDLIKPQMAVEAKPPSA